MVYYQVLEIRMRKAAGVLMVIGAFIGLIMLRAVYGFIPGHSLLSFAGIQSRLPTENTKLKTGDSLPLWLNRY